MASEASQSFIFAPTRSERPRHFAYQDNFIMTHEAKKANHSSEPPCHCTACARATAQADQRRAEIDAILRRLDALEMAIATADQLDRDAE